MKTIRLNPSGKDVPCNDDDTVLAALERSGYALPNNCRAGACGECKCKVVSGEFDQGLVMDMALSEEERAEGYGLMCMAKPTSEVLEIEFGTIDAMPKLFPPRENILCVVTDKIPRTPDIVELRLMPLGEPIRFWPGQYVTLGSKGDGIPERSYSIANIPNRGGEIVLHVSHIPDGQTSGWVHSSLGVGDTVYLNGPYGTFIGDPSLETPVLCLAAGSGLAPISSLIQAAFLRGGFKHPATLLFSAKTRADVYDEGLFAYLKMKFRRFDYKFTLTREDNPGGLTGRIPDILPDLYPDLSGYSVFCAGSPEFVDGCAAAAKALGLPDDHFFAEGFFDQAGPVTPPAGQLL